LTAIPSFLDRLPLAQDAWLYAEEVHGGQIRKSDGRPFIVHPCEVAELLHGAGCSEGLIAAGLLHDTVERTEATLPELERRFGREVARMVGAVTEDPAIGSYQARKAELRRGATESGDEAAILFAADKISKVRQYRDQLARVDSGGDPPRPRRLRHYTESLRLLEHAIPDHPLVGQLRLELVALDSLTAAGSSLAAGDPA
jgi:HD domain